MSGEIPEQATCEVCGTSFDPTESRGWCPNAACGKWQHPAFPLSDGADGSRQEAADGGAGAPTKACPSCGKDVRADANFCKFCSHEFPDEGEQPEAGGADAGLEECPDCGADLSGIPADRLANCPICATDLGDVLADRTEPETTPADLSDCPACGEDLTTIPADMRMVCPNCRTDLEAAIEEHGVPDDGPAQAAGTDPATGGGAVESDSGAGATGGESAAGDAGTGAAAPVDTVKGIGSAYADRLAEAGVETVGDLVSADVRALSAATDVSEKRIREWIERAPVDPADVQSADGDRDGRQGGQSSATPGGQRGGQESGGAGGQATGGTGNQRAGGQGSGQAGGQRGGQGSQQSGQAGGQRGGQGGQRAGGQGGQGSGEADGQGAGGTGSQRAGGQQGSGGRDAAGSGGGRGHDTLVLEVMGQEVRAGPGETLGREVRTAMVEGGADHNDAVYVHREHVRVECEGDAFYLVRLGQNNLKVNGELVGQHERAPVSDGDVVSFSEVVTANVRLE